MLLPEYCYAYTAFLKKKENSLIDMDEIIYSQEDLLKNEEYILKSEQKLKDIVNTVANLPVLNEDTNKSFSSDTLFITPAKTKPISAIINDQPILKLSKKQYILEKSKCIIKPINFDGPNEKQISKQLYEYNSNLGNLNEFYTEFRVFVILPEKVEDYVKVYCGKCGQM